MVRISTFHCNHHCTTRHRFTTRHHAGWPDATEGLYALKKRMIIATLSNGNVRLLVDMVSGLGFYLAKPVRK
jgi:hypothetical protein